VQPQQDPPFRRVLDPTEARQASPRKMNFRVLLVSMALAVVVGVVLVANFWKPTGMVGRQAQRAGRNTSRATLVRRRPGSRVEPGTAKPTEPLEISQKSNQVA
jgi:hypothetical protein